MPKNRLTGQRRELGDCFLVQRIRYEYDSPTSRTVGLERDIANKLEQFEGRSAADKIEVDKMNVYQQPGEGSGVAYAIIKYRGFINSKQEDAIIRIVREGLKAHGATGVRFVEYTWFVEPA